MKGATFLVIVAATRSAAQAVQRYYLWREKMSRRLPSLNRGDGRLFESGFREKETPYNGTKVSRRPWLNARRSARPTYSCESACKPLLRVIPLKPAVFNQGGLELHVGEEGSKGAHEFKSEMETHLDTFDVIGRRKSFL